MNTISLNISNHAELCSVGDLFAKDGHVYIVASSTDTEFNLVCMGTGLRCFDKPCCLAEVHDRAEAEGMRLLGPCKISVTPENNPLPEYLK